MLTWGSIISGHLSEFVRTVAFSADILSFGKPSLFHDAICASSVSIDMGSISGVQGISG